MEAIAPALYDAVVTHSRQQVHRRRFRHHIYLWLVDIDRLPRLPFWLRPFARFRAEDHLDGPAESLRARVEDWLGRHGHDLPGGAVLMLANARVLGYTFNPITVFWCFDPSGLLRCVIAEVHNTYGERHAYLLHPDDRGYAEADKVFYVSPFISVSGRYEIRVPEPGARLEVSIVLRQETTTPIVATVRGRRLPVTWRSVLTVLARRPFMPHWVAYLIRRHGIALWLRRVPLIPRPHTERSPRS